MSKHVLSMYISSQNVVNAIWRHFLIKIMPINILVVLLLLLFITVIIAAVFITWRSFLQLHLIGCTYMTGEMTDCYRTPFICMHTRYVGVCCGVWVCVENILCALGISWCQLSHFTLRVTLRVRVGFHKTLTANTIFDKENPNSVLYYPPLKNNLNPQYYQSCID